MTRPILIGLTGSIGMGKSTVSAFFRDQGIPVWDADAAVHRLYAFGAEGYDAIRALCPSAVSHLGVDRTVLSELIANDKCLLTKIEAAIHPLVSADRSDFIANVTTDMALCDIPLLFEKGSEEQFDITVVVSAPPDVQRERVLARPGMTEDKFETILSRQMPDAEKRQRADHIIDTGTTLAETQTTVEALIAEIRKGTRF